MDLLFWSLFLNFCFGVEQLYVTIYPKVKKLYYAKKNKTN